MERPFRLGLSVTYVTIYNVKTQVVFFLSAVKCNLQW
jgi:hypothetical protein